MGRFTDLSEIMKSLNLEIERWSKNNFAVYINHKFYIEDISREELLDKISRIVDERLL